MTVSDEEDCPVFEVGQAIDYVSADYQIECLRPEGYGHVLSVRVGGSLLYLCYWNTSWLRLYSRKSGERSTCPANLGDFQAAASDFGPLPCLSTSFSLEPPHFSLGPFHFDAKKRLVRYLDQILTPGDNAFIETPEHYVLRVYARTVEVMFPSKEDEIRNLLGISTFVFVHRYGRWYRTSNLLGRAYRSAVEFHRQAFF